MTIKLANVFINFPSTPWLMHHYPAYAKPIGKYYNLVNEHCS